MKASPKQAVAGSLRRWHFFVVGLALVCSCRQQRSQEVPAPQSKPKASLATPAGPDRSWFGEDGVLKVDARKVYDFEVPMGLVLMNAQTNIQNYQANYSATEVRKFYGSHFEQYKVTMGAAGFKVECVDQSKKSRMLVRQDPGLQKALVNIYSGVLFEQASKAPAPTVKPLAPAQQR